MCCHWKLKCTWNICFILLLTRSFSKKTINKYAETRPIIKTRLKCLFNWLIRAMLHISVSTHRTGSIMYVHYIDGKETIRLISESRRPFSFQNVNLWNKTNSNWFNRYYCRRRRCRCRCWNFHIFYIFLQSKR